MNYKYVYADRYVIRLKKEEFQRFVIDNGLPVFEKKHIRFTHYDGIYVEQD
jgi:hypothetical protein